MPRIRTSLAALSIPVRPSCCCLRSSDTRTSLYLGEVSTEEVLEVFPPASPISISEFGATVGERGWLDECQLPQLSNAGELCAFLRARQDIELVDFSATIGACSVWTHDDGEAEIVFPTQAEALSFLHRTLNHTVADSVIAELLEHQGSYVTNRDGTFRAYETFDDYLAGD